MRKTYIFAITVLFTNIMWAQEYHIKKEERFLNKLLKQPIDTNLKWNINNLPNDIYLLQDKERTIVLFDSILKDKSYKKLLDLDFKKVKVKILNNSDAISFKDFNIRFGNISTSYTLTDKKYLLNFEKLKEYIVASGGYVNQDKNKLQVTISSEYFTIYNKESKRWGYFMLDTISLLHIFERIFVKDLIQTYYNLYFEESSKKWDQESIMIFKEILKEDWDSKTYRNLDFETFCDCKIKNYEKVADDFYFSDAFHESKGNEISARCLLISELL